MNDVTSYPLSWPLSWKRTNAGERRRAQFSNRVSEKSQYSDSYYTRKKDVTVAEGVNRLMREVRAFTRSGHQWRIDPDRIVVSTNVRTKIDGLPYSNAKEPDDCGVAIYFKFDGKDSVLACDKWDRVADNIAAIAAHLGALRGQERWGVGSLEQAFAGYIALNEKTQASCWEVLEIPPQSNEQQIMDAFRRKARQAHPDAGGSAEAFDAVVKAKDTALQMQKVAA